MLGMEQPDQPQQYYSYKELAHLCRRSPATIMSIVCRHKIPHRLAYGTRKQERIALFDAAAAAALQRLTLLRGCGAKVRHGD